MADPPAQGKSSFGFLTRKIGPVPIWLIGVAGFGAYWWWTHRKPAAAPASAAPTIIDVIGQRGPRGARGARGPAGRDDDDKRGAGNREVPNVVGQKYTPAAEALRDRGFQAQRATPYVGTVRSEAPHAGTKAPPGSVVTLRGKPWPPGRGKNAPVPPPTEAVAPMTNGAVYSGAPVAGINGETYQPPSVSAAEAAYAPIG